MRELSDKAKSIMRVCLVENEDGSWKDLDQILQEIPYETSKESMQFSLRALVKRGYLVKEKDLELRRKRHRVIYKPTKEAKILLQNLLKTGKEKCQ